MKKLILTSLACVPLAAGTAQASIVVYDNLAAPELAWVEVSLLNFEYGGSFSTPASVSLLSDVKVVLWRDHSAVGSSTVSLWSSVNNNMDTQLATLGSISDSTLTSTPTAYDFSLFTPVPLSPSTRYFISVRADVDTHALWSTAGGNSGIGTAAEYTSSMTRSDQNTANNTAFQMQVTVVPEPATYGLMGGAGLLGFAVWRKRVQVMV